MVCFRTSHVSRTVILPTGFPGNPFFPYVFLTIRLLSAVPRGRPRLGARRTRAPSTITQYEYYSPLTPDGVPIVFGPPPRMVFYTQESREFDVHMCF